MSAHHKTIHIMWKAHEYHYIESSPDFFWAIVSAGVLGIILSVIARNFLFVLIIILAAGLLIIYSRRQPELIDVEISDYGIKFGYDFFPHERVDAFWITEEHNIPHLLIYRESSLIPVTAIPIEEGIDSGHLRDILVNLLPEEKITDSLLHKHLTKLGY